MGEKGAGKEKKGAGEGQKKKEEGQSPLEVKLDMHCEGCAHKVRRAVLKGFKDAEKVAVDAANNKLKMVGGKVDPWKLKEFLESKTGKKVEFISPKDPPKKKADDAAAGDAKKAAGGGDDKDKKKSDDKKPKAPSESTIVLKIRLHCEGCIKRIMKKISKVKGVKEVAVDAAKDLVTVKGTMDAKSLPEILRERLSRSVEVVEPKAKDAKADGGGGGAEKKDKGAGGKGGGDEKKDKGAPDAGKGGGEKPSAALPVPAPASVPVPVPAVEMNRMAYYGGYAPYAALPVPASELNRVDHYGGYDYRMEMMHAPQLFSDENPNACSVM